MEALVINIFMLSLIRKFYFAELELSPVRCHVSDVKVAACGGDFTVWLTSVQGASIQYDIKILLFIHARHSKIIYL